MKKIYSTPEVEITVINSADVITLSSGEGLTPSNIKTVEKTAIDF